MKITWLKTGNVENIIPQEIKSIMPFYPFSIDALRSYYCELFFGWLKAWSDVCVLILYSVNNIFHTTYVLALDPF